MADEGYSIGIVVLSTDEAATTGMIIPWMIKSVGSNGDQDFHLQDGNGHTVFRARGQAEVYFGNVYKTFTKLTVASSLAADHWIHIYER